MANLSNINNILRVSSSGVGLNKNNTGPSELDIESSGADMIDMTRTGQKTYRFAISGTSAFSLFDVAANADRLIIDSSGNSTFAGNVGIGAAASDGNLHVRKTGVNTGITNVLMNANFADGSNGTGLSIGYRTDETTAVIAARTATGNIAFYSYDGGWSESMRIKNNGSVGIGTDSPGEKLEVAGNVGVNGFITHNGDSGTFMGWSANDTNVFYTAGNERMRIDSNGNVGIAWSSPSDFTSVNADNLVVGPGTGSNGITVFSATNAYGQLAFADGTGTNDQYKGLIQYAHPDDSMRLFTANTEKMRIQSDGNVGIGTSSPTNLLTINDPNANGSITDTIPSWWGLVIDRAYSTSSSAAIAVIGGTVATGSSGRLYLGNSDDVDNSYIDGGANQLHFAVGGEKMRITSDGKIGLNTSSFAPTISNQLKLGDMGSGVVGEVLDASVVNGAARMIICSGGATGQVPILSLRHYSAAYGIDIWMYWASPWNTYIDNRHPSSGFIFRNNCNASGGENALMEISGTGRILMHGLDGKTQVHPDVSYRTSDGELFYQTSSIRYKKDIVNLENSLNKIDSLRPVRFTDINTNEPSFGLIAEETNEIIPDVVFTKDEQVEGISYSNLTPFLIKAIQELKADNDSLKARIETLENN